MSYRLLITNDANNDIDEIISYIVNELNNPIAARNLLSEIESGFETISFNPHAFPLCSDKRLHDEPNPEMSSFVFRETLMTYLLLWGNAYAQIIRNGKGEVITLYPLMPNKMTFDRDADGHL